MYCNNGESASIINSEVLNLISYFVLLSYDNDSVYKEVNMPVPVTLLYHAKWESAVEYEWLWMFGDFTGKWYQEYEG